MRGARPLPWLLLALATGVLGFVLGRSTATPALPEALGASPAPAPATARAGPTLSSAPAAPMPPARNLPRAGAVPAPEGVPPEAEPVPIDLVSWLGGASPPGTPQDPRARVDDPTQRSLQDLTGLLRADPEAAARRLDELLESGREDDRRLALAALGAARHPLHLRLAERVRAEARPGDDLEGLLRALARLKGRDWSPEQMTGPPDTLRAGDLPTAWASQSADCGDVWVECDFATAVVPEQLRVHETCAPGAITHVYLWQGEPGDPDGRWLQAWSGEGAVADPPAWHEIPLTLALRTRSVRLVVATSRVTGWNEIDAVELVAPGLRQWAAAARAGSSYGQ